jgi:hypothetical protein
VKSVTLQKPIPTNSKPRTGIGIGASLAVYHIQNRLLVKRKKIKFLCYEKNSMLFMVLPFLTSIWHICCWDGCPYHPRLFIFVRFLTYCVADVLVYAGLMSKAVAVCLRG